MFNNQEKKISKYNLFKTNILSAKNLTKKFIDIELKSHLISKNNLSENTIKTESAILANKGIFNHIITLKQNINENKFLAELYHKQKLNFPFNQYKKQFNMINSELLDKSNFLHTGQKIIIQAFGKNSLQPWQISYPSELFSQIYQKNDFAKIYSLEKGALGVEQTNYGDCWFESTIASLAQSKSGRKYLSKIITQNTDENYKVKFKDIKPSKVNISVSEAFENKNIKNDSAWADILEAANAKLHPKSVENGNDPSLAMKNIRGQKYKVYDISDKKLTNSKKNLVALAIKNCLAMDKPVMIGTKDSVQETKEMPIVGDHYYSVLGIKIDKNEPSQFYILVRNPWGTSQDGRLEPKVEQENGFYNDTKNVINFGQGIIGIPSNILFKRFDSLALPKHIPSYLDVLLKKYENSIEKIFNKIH